MKLEDQMEYFYVVHLKGYNGETSTIRVECSEEMSQDELLKTGILQVINEKWENPPREAHIAECRDREHSKKVYSTFDGEPSDPKDMERFIQTMKELGLCDEAYSIESRSAVH